MYGFRPARNRKHPGDPPPKWAPIGRLGRISILLTVVAGVVIALLVIGTRPADALDDTPDAPTPEPPPWFGGRVEMPEHGFAVTLPDDWLAFDLTGDLEAQARQAVGTDAAEETVQSVVETLLYAQQQGAHLTTIATTPPWSSCGIWLLPSVGEDLDVFATLFSEGVTSDGRTVCERPQPVGLPIGPARLIECVSDVAESVQYVGGGVDAGFAVLCAGMERPDDDWLSIAETIEFLSAEE